VDSLEQFVEKDPALKPKLLGLLRELETSGSKALASRARQIRSRMVSVRG
jgi:hypothetical protein